MFKLGAGLPKTEAELRDHAKALCEMMASEKKDLFSHLYECLSILDTKSSSLLASNAITSAVFAIFMSNPLPRCEWITLNAGMASILVSSLLLLWVVWVHWSTTADLRNLDGHALVLLTVWRSRTICYRLAWFLSVLAIVALLVFLVLRFF
jgi:hypothetical protein